jgi:hypothetical protein
VKGLFAAQNALHFTLDGSALFLICNWFAQISSARDFVQTNCKSTANQLQTNRKPIRKSLAPKLFGHLTVECHPVAA